MGVSAPQVSAVNADPYWVNNVLDGEPVYVGKVRADGTWLMEKFSPASGVKTYANRSNNAGTSDYATAWTNKATLTYDVFQNLTGA
jgi:hypothetical protein